MIRALVVDDEKRVRQGFMMVADWEAHGIRIVGEAKDGHSALAFLGKQAVDLLFVDISMPGMNGFELIEQVRDRYPDTRSVILTCHHEFDYVQEALRLGAIDYIVKTLFGPDNAEESIRRVMKRLSREAKPSASVRRFQAAACYAAVRPDADPEALRQALPPGRTPLPLHKGLCFVPMGEGESPDWIRHLPDEAASAWHALHVVSSEDCALDEAKRRLARHMGAYLFYAAPPPGSTVSLEELQTFESGSGPAVEEAFAEWGHWRWLLYGEAWRRFIGQVESLRPEPERLRTFLHSVPAGGLAYFRWLAFAWDRGDKDGLHAAARFAWKDWKTSLTQLTLQVQQRLTETAISREVAGSLLAALQYMSGHAEASLNQEAVARHAGMSRSYFSQCFKRFTGMTFAETFRQMKIRQAQELLLGTRLSIPDIAGRAGFEDDKYFSRVFRELTGQLPSEFRAGSADRGPGKER